MSRIPLLSLVSLVLVSCAGQGVVDPVFEGPSPGETLAPPQDEAPEAGQGASPWADPLSEPVAASEPGAPIEPAAAASIAETTRDGAPKGVEALGQIRFGDSVDDFRLRVEQDPMITLLKGLACELRMGTQTYSMWPSFHGGELWKVSISGGLRDQASYQTELRADRDGFVALIKPLFGEPDWTGPDPGPLDLKTDHVQFTHRWDLDGKTVRVGVGETNLRYRAALWITDPVRERDAERDVEATAAR